MKTNKTSRRALLIDGNALLHRAWHALPPLTAPDGRVVNAVYGFSMALIKILELEHPEILVVCWDTAEPTYRHKANAEYKAQRVEQPDEFYAQFPLVKEVVWALGGTNAEQPGYEADDLLATYATQLRAEGVHATILTSDRDVWQLIGDGIEVLAFKKGVSETVRYDREELVKTIGLMPEQIPGYKALRGDPSDNLKGVAGIGEKTATELLQRFQTLEGIFDAAKDDTSEMTPSVRQKLLQGEADALATLHLVKLVCNAPLPVPTTEIDRRPADELRVRELFTTFGFKTLLARLGKNAEKEEKKPGQKKEMTKAIQVMRPSHTNVNVVPSTRDGLLDFVAAAEAEGAMFIYPVEQTQSSLFAEAPVLVCGTRELSLVLNESHLGVKAVREAVERLLASPTLLKHGYGLKRVCRFVMRRGWVLAGFGFDVQIAAYILNAGEAESDLTTLAATHLGVQVPPGDERALYELNALRDLVPFFEREIEREDLRRVMDTFETPLIPVLTRMEETGVLIDRAYFRKLSEDFRVEKKRLEDEMAILAGEPFNPGSPQQLAHILFEVLELPTKGIKRGKTGISTAASEMEKLEGAHPIIEKVGAYREVAKLLSTYVEALPELADAEGRVHTTFNQTLTATGRLSSSNPNLQNIPIRTELGRKIRRGFVAPKGFCLLSCDYSQIELRVIAALAHDEKMLDAFRRGLDIHTATAAAIWHVALHEVTKEQRRAAKAINFGIMYGQGPVGLSKGAGISFEAAKKFISEYFEVYAGVRAFLEETKERARRDGYVETLFGRRRPIPDIESPLQQLRAAAERTAINMPVQGTSADIMKRAMIEVAEKLPIVSPSARMLLQVHDELVLEVQENEVDRVATLVATTMEQTVEMEVPIVVEAKAGVNWDEMQRIER